MKKNSFFKAAVFAAAVSLAASTTLTAYADIPKDGATNAGEFSAITGNTADWEKWKTEWDTVKENWEFVSVTPGSNESEMNFAWYSKTKNADFMVSKNKDMSNPVFSKTIVGTADESNKKGDVQYYTFKASVNGLTKGTYFYRVNDGKTYSFNVNDVSDGFSFIFVGDPQIGSSNSMKGSKANSEEALAKFYSIQSDAVRNDSFIWNYTLTRALEQSPNASFVLSAGDQIQSRKKDMPTVASDNTFSEVEYAGFLGASALRSLPFAPAVGNHDSTLPNYSYHFNTPNNSSLGSNGIVGGDYWFTYGNALFMVLNTQDTDNEEHKQFIKETVAANPDSKWRFVTLHQDIYGSAEHSNEPEITDLRYELVPCFEENDIDVVFAGHDHAYSRSLLLKGGKKTSTYYDDKEDEFEEMFELDISADSEITGPVYTAYQSIKSNTSDEKQKAYLEYLKAVGDAYAVENTDAEVAKNPDGILYLSANSSSGSKFYDLTSRQQDYVAGRWQEDIPTYSVIDITDTTFTVNTYRVDTNEKIDTKFTIEKDASKESSSSGNPDTGVEGVSITMLVCGAAVITLFAASRKRK